MWRLGAEAVQASRLQGVVIQGGANLSILERLALPTPKVHAVGEFDGRWGVLMDRAPSSCFADQFVSTAESAPLEDMAQLHRRLHEKPGDGLPSLMARLSARIRRAEGLDAASRNRLLLELDSLPDGDRVCHGDFHPWNIHGSGQGFMIVDWLDACCGNPLADVCRTYVLLHHGMPGRAMGYVEAYASVTGSEVSGILAWLPAIAAARLTEGVANEMTSCCGWLAFSHDCRGFEPSAGVRFVRNHPG
ncbi:phosphotransferase family protein [Rhizobium laguerreae]|uniref:phosphotransferase family protein n=1 Tax=Rhizobium laguerreae TaxID=1076926 RepID=UPI0028B23478|nr:aminoglycoside phosphotransferase family protein [Rhizobium laguerreae]